MGYVQCRRPTAAFLEIYSVFARRIVTTQLAIFYIAVVANIYAGKGQLPITFRNGLYMLKLDYTRLESITFRNKVIVADLFIVIAIPCAGSRRMQYVVPFRFAATSGAIPHPNAAIQVIGYVLNQMIIVLHIRGTSAIAIGIFKASRDVVARRFRAFNGVTCHAHSLFHHDIDCARWIGRGINQLAERIIYGYAVHSK